MINKYTESVKQKICSICVDSDDKGNCLLTDDEICAVEFYLPRIVRLVHSLNSKDMDEYVSLLRKQICSNCNSGKGEDSCYLREDANCALDRYFPVIVEVIKKTDGETI